MIVVILNSIYLVIQNEQPMRAFPHYKQPLHGIILWNKLRMKSTQFLPDGFSSGQAPRSVQQ